MRVNGTGDASKRNWRCEKPGANARLTGLHSQLQGCRMKTSLTVLQRTNFEGFPKAGELIEITGAYELEAADRAILNLLYQHAHDSGRMGDDRAEWEIPMSELRTSSHRGKARVRDSVDRLLRVVVTVPLPDCRTGEPR